MTDIITNGRLDLGIARGAYSFEYERLMPGLDAWGAGQRMRELIPAVKKLWEGDYAHEGEFWKFPSTTSSPLPLQRPHPPIWVAARDPNSHEFAVSNGCNVQVTPLHLGDEEVEKLVGHFNAACEKFRDVPRPQIMLLRHTYVASSEDDAQLAADEVNTFYNYFGAWFRNERPVSRGMIKPLTKEEIAAHPFYTPETMRRNNVIGTPEEVISRLRAYEKLGFDEYIVSNTSRNLAKVSLELGGKSPFIVFADADIQSAVNAQVAAIFAASGQSCVAGSRLLIEASVKERFLELLVERVSRIRVGSPNEMTTEYGPLCTERQLRNIEKIVERSVSQGAKVLAGGKALERNGYYYAPTILDCTGVSNADSVTTELFGPVLSVDTFSSEHEAIEKANSTAYGLAAGIFTTNLTRAHRVSRRVRSGIVWINTYRAVSPLVPFGGFGLSGHGREGGMAAALEYTTTKSVWLRTSDEPISDPFVMR